MGGDLKEALIPRRIHFVRASLVVKLNLNGVVGPSHDQEMVFAVVHSLLQFQDLGSAPEVDVHSQLAFLNLQGQEVGDIVDHVVRGRSGVDQGPHILLCVEDHGNVGVSTGRHARLPGPTLAIERGSQALAVGSKEFRIVRGAVASVAVERILGIFKETGLRQNFLVHS